jgi:hypothetical protein
MNSVTHAEDSSQVVKSLRSDRDKHTVGYGDRYPEPDTDHFAVEDTNANGGVHHRNQSNEFGFDLTSFGNGRHGVQSFLAVLETAGLHPTNDHYRVFRDMGRGVDASYHDRFVFVWANHQMRVACSNNPITGEANGPNINAEQGDAGYMGIAGDAPLVDDVVKAVNEHTTTKSEMRAGDLFY